MESWGSVPDDELARVCARRPIVEAAWLEFWQRFQPLVHRRVLLALTKFSGHILRAEVDDMVQQVFIKLMHGLSQFDPARSPLRAFISLLASNVIFDQLRRSRDDQAVSLDDSSAPMVKATPALDLMSKWDAVTACLSRLEEAKARIVAEYLKGDDIQQICQRHLVTPGNVYTMVSRFRKCLRERLEK